METPVAQLVYVSTPRDCAPGELPRILEASRRRNAGVGITGALVVRPDLFLQLLEGPRQAVTDTFARILADPRHAEVTLISMQDADFRLFGAWEMRVEEMPSWMWTEAEVAAGLPRTAPQEDVFAMFHRIASLPAPG